MEFRKRANKSQDEGEEPAGPPSYYEATDDAAAPAYDDARSSSLAAGAYIDEKKQASWSAPVDASNATLTFDIGVQTGWFFSKTLTVRPTGPMPATLPATAGWRLDFRDKYSARLERLGSWPTHQETPVRPVADLAFPSVEVPFMGGVSVTFLPLEEDVEHSPRYAAPAKRFLETGGVVTTQYALNFPARSNARCLWTTTPPSQHRSPSLQPGPTTAGGTPTANSSSSSSNGKSEWTPFLTHYFVEESSGDLMASYTRSAPWAPERGKLEIYQTKGPVSPKFLEGLVTVCAAMVAVQDHKGLLSSLVEAGADAFVGKGKGTA